MGYFQSEKYARIEQECRSRHCRGIRACEHRSREAAGMPDEGVSPALYTPALWPHIT